MATKFIFDKQSGTLKPCKADIQSNIQEQQPQNTSASINDADSPEEQEGIFKFRAVSDLTSFQIVDEQTRKVMAVISGYGLSIRFNMEELRSTDKVEQLLNGLTAMFRKLIIEQSLGGGDVLKKSK